MKIHHVGYLVKNIEKSAAAFRAVGFSDILYPDGSFICYDGTRDCDICFMEHNENGASVCIELISPQSSGSPICGLMEKYKNSPYHMCFESDDFEKDIENLRAKGWSVFTQPAAAPAIDGKNVVFLIHRSAGIIELIDVEKK